MRKGPNSQRQNSILAALQAEDAEILTRILTPVELERRRYLAHRDRRIEYVYFIDSGVASVIADASSVRSVEVGMVGSEGLTGLGALMGASKSPYDTFMQVAGRGRRCQPAALKQAMDNSPALRECIMHYAHAFMVQIAQTALSNARGKLEERLARWLLMVHDRTDGDEVQLTHDFLATMLGVRRAGVSVAVKHLEKLGLVEVRRGVIMIADRDGLVQSSNGAYGVAERALLEVDC